MICITMLSAAVPVFATEQQEPNLTQTPSPWQKAAPNGDVEETTVQQYTFTFTTVPENAEELAQYSIDSPYKAMALLCLAFRTWTTEDHTTCEQMLDLLTDTRVKKPASEENYKFSEYSQWKSELATRMNQNTKYRFIGNAYFDGATPENDYTPNEPLTITMRQSTKEPYAAATETTPELIQVLIKIAGDDNERKASFYEDEQGNWKIWSDEWRVLLSDVQTPVCDRLMPPEYEVPANPENPQTEPTLVTYEVPAKASGYDDWGNPIVIDTTVMQYSYTFTTIPTCYEDIVQYRLDSPYKTMALLCLALRTWDKNNRTVCEQMLDYLTFTNIDSYQTDAQGRKLSKKFSQHQFWTDALRDRMMQNNKYEFIGNAYLEGAMPANNYTPTEPITITVRQSVYDPYYNGSATDPSLKQVLISLPGSDSDRYSLFYQDQRGDWRVFSDNWQGMLVDVKLPGEAIPWPAEVVRSQNPATPQTEPVMTERDVPAQVPLEGGGVEDTTVKEYTFTFSTVPTCYEDIVQYSLDSPYKTMALAALAFRTWTPENPTDCEEMLSYLTNTAVEKPGATDAESHKLCYAFSEYAPWKSFLRERMMQNNKYQFIGNAYLNGATPANEYQPDTPISVTVRQSVYDPFREATDTVSEIKQVLVSIAGDENARYSLFYRDQRGDWRIFGDNWLGLLSDVQIGGNPAVENPVRNGGTVTFTVHDNGEYFTPLVAAYDENGKMIGVTEAIENDGTFSASVDPDAANVRIFLASAAFRPLCESVGPQVEP